MKKTFIYTLVDPISGHVRYVGKTDYPDTRLKYHIKSIKVTKNKHKVSWIKNLLTMKLKPILEIIDEVNYSEWEFWEQHYISLYKSWGFKLINKTFGGEGATSGIPLCIEHRKKISEAKKGKVSNRKNAIVSDDQKSKISKSLKFAYSSGKRNPINHSEEIRKKISLKQRNNYLNGRVLPIGEKNGMYGKTKEVFADGLQFKSQDECAKYFNVHPKTVAYRIKSDNFPSYFFKK